VSVATKDQCTAKRSYGRKARRTRTTSEEKCTKNLLRATCKRRQRYDTTLDTDGHDRYEKSRNGGLLRWCATAGGGGAVWLARSGTRSVKRFFRNFSHEVSDGAPVRTVPARRRLRALRIVPASWILVRCGLRIIRFLYYARRHTQQPHSQNIESLSRLIDYYHQLHHGIHSTEASGLPTVKYPALQEAEVSQSECEREVHSSR
jgi:hypothetical protein